MWKLFTVILFNNVLILRASEEDSSYGMPEGRCIGRFSHADAKPKSGVEAIMQFEPRSSREESCFLACRLHRECWAFEMKQLGWRTTCVLYGNESVEVRSMKYETASINTL